MPFSDLNEHRDLEILSVLHAPSRIHSISAVLSNDFLWRILKNKGRMLETINNEMSDTSNYQFHLAKTMMQLINFE